MSLAIHPPPAAAPPPEAIDRPTVNQRIAIVLGHPTGSYELLIGAHICEELNVDPEFRGQLVGQPDISTGTLTWLTEMARSGDGADHAAEILVALRS